MIDLIGDLFSAVCLFVILVCVPFVIARVLQWGGRDD